MLGFSEEEPALRDGPDHSREDMPIVARSAEGPEISISTGNESRHAEADGIDNHPQLRRVLAGNFEAHFPRDVVLCHVGRF